MTPEQDIRLGLNFCAADEVGDEEQVVLMNAAIQYDLESFYFGNPGKALFGCHHQPGSIAARDCAVVLCNPLGYEYIRSHRAYRQLAARLAQSGFHTLRYDLYGTGDSAGDDEHADVGRWLADISTAVDTMRERTGMDNVCLIGLRFGGTLAMLAAAERNDVSSVVLWDPIVKGSAYLDELLDKHNSKLQYLPAASPEPVEAVGDVLGFRWTEQFLTDLRGIDLLSHAGCRTASFLLVVRPDNPDGDPLHEHLASRGANVAFRRIPDHAMWVAEQDTLLVPQRVIQWIAEWANEIYQ